RWGLFPWYGVTFLADHIDNITYTFQGFANKTIRGFEYLSNTQRSHRLTLLKHDMALDYILAKQGGLCVTLNLTGEACYTLIPDNSDNMTIRCVIEVIEVQMNEEISQRFSWKRPDESLRKVIANNYRSGRTS
uniref:Uncharacterized protein n=1 Tax=Cyclopterus lumpus TaxID=8103 RepID=A0A8C2Z3D8_CYCLU